MHSSSASLAALAIEATLCLSLLTRECCCLYLPSPRPLSLLLHFHLCHNEQRPPRPIASHFVIKYPRCAFPFAFAFSFCFTFANRNKNGQLKEPLGSFPGLPLGVEEALRQERLVIIEASLFLPAGHSWHCATRIRSGKDIKRCAQVNGIFF